MRRQAGTLIMLGLCSLPASHAADMSNMTDTMVTLLVTLLPVMLIIMLMRMMMGQFSS